MKFHIETGYLKPSVRNPDGTVISDGEWIYSPTGSLFAVMPVDDDCNLIAAADLVTSLDEIPQAVLRMLDSIHNKDDSTQEFIERVLASPC